MRNRMIIHPHPLLSRERAGVRGRFVQVLFAFVIVCFCLSAPEARANNIGISNVEPTELNTANSNMLVEFDLAWENSWSVGTRRDAAWVFVKFRPQGTNEWFHATLSTNDSDHAPASGSTIDTPSDGKGAFVYRSAEGTGDVNYVEMGLRWNYGADGQSFNKGDLVEINVFAIEMVYIAPGSFRLGDGTSGTIQGQFESATNGTPFLVTNESYEITLGGGTAGSLGNNNTAGMYAGSEDDFNDITSQTLSNAFPKGYAAFYCMKYEISQGQYADFLNKLNDTQDNNRREATLPTTYRYTIIGGYTNYSAGAPDRACNYISVADGCAYADWSGLRPMSELEFEKACRGPETPVADEYAWGSNNIHAVTYAPLNNDGQPNETVSNPGIGTGNASYDTTDGVIDGPLRCGIFAASFGSPTRAEAGASYYGVMELSGNLWERPVTVGNAKGRSFMGTHGDGSLAANGDHTNSDWPVASSALGAGFRGGGWSYVAVYARVSDRYYAAGPYSGRSYSYGWRAVRLAP